MDATSPNRKSLFLNLVLFAAGSFCGYLLNSHLDTVYIREQNSYHAAGAFEVSSLMRPLGKTQSHLVKYDPTICNKLKQIPCSECKAAKLSISAADQKRREASLKRYERSHNSIHGVHCNHADTHSTRSAAMAVRRRNSFQSSNVDHYRMPAYKVGVGIQDRLSPTTYLALGNKTHRCIVQKPDPGYYSEVRGFPGIYANDAVLNIFLASTNEAKAVGFDPHPLLARIGHNEFFLSALGRLRVAACSFCAVHHVRGGPVPGNYSRYRKPDKRFKAKLEKLQPIYA
ncbi:PREDICTED: uncharacterized protein LOC109474378 isoform X2 [Branchiostoma belcheri]|uniref:Uncharacterized protein LOC109474378 isoform X2 n=1 Tax=Branchiostoma belcheri TaxID=7741 RepID=A0A6P4Z130_BRABE|nr:PREDICTED: uncharacterized protein LOC109474378 isoform X2 [Branchiostoma belcheri]